MSPATSHARDRRRGFTLIEVTVAAFILVLGIAGLSGLILRLMNTAYLTGTTTAAVEQAQDRMELLLGAGYTNGVSGADTAAPFTRTWSAAAAGSRFATLDVNVAWPVMNHRTNNVAVRAAVVDMTVSTSSLNFTNFPRGFF